MKIRISEITVKKNFRKDFNPTDMEELKKSLDEQGLIQPITVTKVDDSYILVAGERRLRAADELGWKNIECHVKDYGIKGTDTNQRVADGVFENIKRQSYTPSELAKAMAWLKRNWEEQGLITTRSDSGRKSKANKKDENKAAGQSSFAEKAEAKTGMSKAKVNAEARLGSRASPAVLSALDAGDITKKQAQILVEFDDPVDQDKILEQVIGVDLKQTKEIAARYKPGSSEAESDPVQEGSKSENTRRRRKAKGETVDAVTDTAEGSKSVSWFNKIRDDMEKVEHQIGLALGSKFKELDPQDGAALCMSLSAFHNKIGKHLERANAQQTKVSNETLSMSSDTPVACDA